MRSNLSWLQAYNSQVTVDSDNQVVVFRDFQVGGVSSHQLASIEPWFPRFSLSIPAPIRELTRALSLFPSRKIVCLLGGGVHRPDLPMPKP